MITEGFDLEIQSVVFDYDTNVTNVKFHITSLPAEAFFEGYVCKNGHLRLNAIGYNEPKNLAVLYAYISGWEKYIVERIMENAFPGGEQ